MRDDAEKFQPLGQPKPPPCTVEPERPAWRPVGTRPGIEEGPGGKWRNIAPAPAPVVPGPWDNWTG